MNQVSSSKKSTGTISLILGIIGLIFCYGITGIPAIIFGYKNTDPKEAGMATAGIILGWVATILGVCILLFILAIIVIAPHGPTV